MHVEAFGQIALGQSYGDAQANQQPAESVEIPKFTNVSSLEAFVGFHFFHQLKMK